MTRVLFAADFEIFDVSLQMLLGIKSKIELVGYVTNGNDAVLESIKKNPDLIIMCLNSCETSLYMAIKKIKAYDYKIRIWVVSFEENKKMAEMAMKNGADGYFIDDIHINNLFVVLLEKYYHTQEKKEIFCVRKYENEKQLKGEEYYLNIHLTTREREVLRLVIEGMTNSEIAICLGISVGRARNIVTELIMKCMVKNRTQLAVLAVKMGI